MTKPQMVLTHSLLALAEEMRIMTGGVPMDSRVTPYDVKGTMRVNIAMVEKHLNEAKELAK